MASFVTDFKHLEIPLEDIKSATNNFDESKVIGRGGFGKVYKGELSRSQSGEKSLVAIKRLDRRFGQGDTEFFKEIRMLSCYRHENLISLLGFCCQWDEMILIYEYAFGGSLDRLLSSADLTWTQRLRICVDAAKGLRFLHDPKGTQQRVLHCDIKSANILLDKNMTAKVSDFGLSKMGPANQQYSLLITGALGTPGYCDPVFMETYSLTKESDVYSFGIVLFEVLCGKLCVEYSKDQIKAIHVPMWKQSYEENKLNEIILQNLMQQMDPSSLKTFSDIAFQCLRKAREERPTMSRVVEELDIALESQEFPELRLEMLTKHEDILKAADPLTYVYKTGNQLKELLSKGLTINEGNTWLSITKNGGHIERICILACVNRDEINDFSLRDQRTCERFPEGRCYLPRSSRFKARVRGEYLTPHISYTLNLVFRYKDQSDINHYNQLRYSINGEAKAFTIYPSTPVTEDGWFVAPLYHFTSQNKTADLQFELQGPVISLLFAGFEFQPYEEKVQLPVFEEYRHIIEAASQSISYTSLDELKQILRIGIHLKDYKTWFSLNEKGQHCHLISMEDCLRNEDFPYASSSLSRFPAGFYHTKPKGFKTHVKTELLSTLIPYTVNLVFYFPSCLHQAYVDLKYRINGDTRTSIVYLAEKIEACLYMAELCQVSSNGGLVDLEIDFENSGMNIKSVDGILFQPLEKMEDQVLEDDKVENIQPILDSDSDTYWGQKLPNDYEEMLKLSKHSVEGKTKKELYSLLCQGFLMDNGHQWFTVDKNGKKCQMLSTRATSVIDEKNSTWESSNESRFGEVLVKTAGYKFKLVSEIEPTTLSPDTTYASYLAYKLPQDQSSFESPLEVRNKRGTYYCRYIYSYLVSPPNTPVIGQKLDEISYQPLNRHRLNGLPRQRSDGWMEVKVWDFQTKKTSETVSMDLEVEHHGKKGLRGLIIQGVEIRPT